MMQIRGLSASRRRNVSWRYFAVACLCAFLQVAAADEIRDDQSQDTPPEADADTTENTMPEIRIKRLRLADPESKEVMLAGRPFHCAIGRAS